MQRKDIHKPVGGLNTDDDPSILPPEDYTDALNMRITSSSEQHGVGVAETLQSEIEVLLDTAMGCLYYYGSAIGGQFVYEGYEEVQIGTQVWMKRNWDVNFPGSKVYDNDEDNREVYGGLYNWYQINQDNFVPDGWHVPTEAEINTLLTYVGGVLIAGGKLKEFGLDHWLTPNTDGGDNFGFKALPGGKYDSVFNLLTEAGLFWLADEHAPLNPTSIYIETALISEPFYLYIEGTQDVIINWGDGSAEEVVTLVGMGSVYVEHSFVGASTIEIKNTEGITSIISETEDNMTSCIIPPTCISIEHIEIGDCPDMGSFETHKEWANLNYLYLFYCGLSSLDTYAEWVLLETLTVNDNPLTNIELHPEWVNLYRLSLGSTQLTSITLPVEYVNLNTLILSNTPITSLEIPKEYVSLSWLSLNTSDLASLIVPAECVFIGLILASATHLTTFEAHSEWTFLSDLNLRYCNISSATDINNILIALDAIPGGGPLNSITLNDGTNAAPTGAGIIAKNSLIGKGITVTTN